jgi:E3 ubiquitin-protein ligase MARCH6
MRYSRKEYCELCSYRFSFTPIYAPDMPRRLPIKDVAAGITSSILTGVKYWLHFTLVGLAWLCVVPFTACRIYRSLFNGSFDAVCDKFIKYICFLFYWIYFKNKI